MSKDLLSRLRAARGTRIPSRGVTFIGRRPTAMEMAEMRSGVVRQGDLITRFITGWEGLREMDLVPGGGPDPVPFDAELFAEYIADHPEHWENIVKGVRDEYDAYEARLEESLKNLQPGSTG